MRNMYTRRQLQRISSAAMNRCTVDAFSPLRIRATFNINTVTNRSTVKLRLRSQSELNSPRDGEIRRILSVAVPETHETTLNHISSEREGVHVYMTAELEVGNRAVASSSTQHITTQI